MAFAEPRATAARSHPSTPLDTSDTLRFGIYTESQCPPEKSHYGVTWEILI